MKTCPLPIHGKESINLTICKPRLLFWDSHYARAVWSSFLQELGVCFVGSRSDRATIKEFLLHLPFNDKGGFLLLVGVCTIVWDIWGERNDRVFRGREKEHSRLQYQSIFVITLLVTFYLVGPPYDGWGVLVGWIFFTPLYSLQFDS